MERAIGRVYRPELSARAEDGSTLSVPLVHDGFIQMKGRKVFTEAVRSMVASLNRVCQRENLTVQDLQMVVPHQANARILNAVARGLGLPSERIPQNIDRFGNTTAASIPILYHELRESGSLSAGDLVCFVAFGAGAHWGAALYREP